LTTNSLVIILTKWEINDLQNTMGASRRQGLCTGRV
jgi:hypothetical protein